MARLVGDTTTWPRSPAARRPKCGRDVRTVSTMTCCAMAGVQGAAGACGLPLPLIVGVATALSDRGRTRARRVRWRRPQGVCERESIGKAAENLGCAGLYRHASMNMKTLYFGFAQFVPSMLRTFRRFQSCTFRPRSAVLPRRPARAHGSVMALTCGSFRAL